MRFFGGVGHGLMNSQLDFGGVLDLDLNFLKDSSFTIAVFKAAKNKT